MLVVGGALYELNEFPKERAVLTGYYSLLLGLNYEACLLDLPNSASVAKVTAARMAATAKVDLMSV